MSPVGTIMISAALAGGSLAGQPVVGDVTPSWFSNDDARGGQVGGMVTPGWDGDGQHATTLSFHIENASPWGTQAGQRTAMLAGLRVWADLVQVHFVESAIPNRARSIDFRWEEGAHCDNEPGECGDQDCVFDGDGGRFYHAAYPPGGDSFCGGVATESMAGNIHFDVDDRFQENVGMNGISLALTAAHGVGHALGLRHDTVNDPNAYRSIMDNRDLRDRGLNPPSQNDIFFIREGYAAGQGSVTTLEDIGVWVNGSWQGPELGTPGSPFDTVAEGVGGVPPFAPNVVVHLLGGVYPENITISKPCIITADFSTAFIGR